MMVKIWIAMVVIMMFTKLLKINRWLVIYRNENSYNGAGTDDIIINDMDDDSKSR